LRITAKYVFNNNTICPQVNRNNNTMIFAVKSIQRQHNNIVTRAEQRVRGCVHVHTCVCIRACVHEHLSFVIITETPPPPTSMRAVQLVPKTKVDSETMTDFLKN
jgi:hypothetical protein